MKLLLFVLIAINIFLFLEIFYEKRVLQKINKYISIKNEYYYKEFLKKYEKSKKIRMSEKMNLKYKISLLIDRAGLSQNVIINPIALVMYGIICFLCVYIFVFSIFKMRGVSIIISIPCATLPFVILNVISSYKNEKIEKVFLNFLLQLKNYTKISNDVISAFRNVKTLEPLQTHLNKFNLEINSGVKFETAIEHLKEKILVKKFKEFFTNVEYCYLYGGNFSNLIDRNYKTINDLQKEKDKRRQETQGARIVLIILVIMDICIYMNFVKNNVEYFQIMKNNLIGVIILYWNFISMWILILLSEKVKKLDY